MRRFVKDIVKGSVEIPLTQGKSAWVDHADYESLRNFNWYACRSRNNFYARRVEKPKIRMHSFIVAASSGQVIDHINCNTLDNRRSNLRIVTYSQNAANRTGANKNSFSGVRGVCWNKKISKWQAYIKFNYRHIHLGVYENIKNAKEARKKAEEKYFAYD